MTAVVTVAPILVNALRHIAHQVQVWKDLVKLLKRGPQRPHGSLRQVASEPHPPQRKRESPRRSAPPEDIWIAAIEFIVNTPKLPVDRHRAPFANRAARERIVSGRDSGDTMSEARVFAQDPPELWPMKRHRSLAIQIDASTPARRDPARRPRRTRQPQTAPAMAITATDLGVLARQAALAITLAVADPTANADDALRVLRFGSQTDAQPLHPSRSDITVDTVDVRRRPGRSVASYLAKYVTKSVAEFGIGIQRMSPLAIPTLDVSDHVRTILTTIVTLAGHRAYQGIDRWLHTWATEDT